MKGFLALVIPFCLLFSPWSVPKAFAADVWRVLAIRVSFPPEAPDNATTSGDGGFDFRSPSEARPDYRYLYDTPPHDRAYFEAHLQALSHYYGAVSGGRTKVEYEVWPRGARDSYRLRRPLIEYGNGRTRQEVAQRITELFRDGIAAADSAEGGRLDFSGFRAFVVFHAGLGAEARSGRAFNDIPSAFVTEEDLKRYLQGPIRAQGGRATIRSGMLLPEAISADGRGGLNGTLARFFGSQLGLPGLSNYRDDLPAAGGWSLMDVGSNRVIPREIAERLPGYVRDATGLVGFAPVLPEAWSRVRLGWTVPLTVTRDTTVRIPAADLSTTLPGVVRIPITSDEYFLLENRETRLRPGEIPGIAFSRGDSGGVWLSVDRRDAFIPGSGLLVWHVDETVIRAATDEHGVNDDPHRRGLRLMEADGYQDIGNIYVPFDRVDQIEGGPDDPYYVGGKSAEIGPGTLPDTRSNAGYPTGIRIIVKSPPRDTMTVSISFDRTSGGWPVTGLPEFGENAPRALDLDGDGVREVLTATPDGRLYAFRANGRPFVPGTDGLWVAGADSLTFTPAAGDLDGDRSEDLVIASSSGLVAARSVAKGLLWSVRLAIRPSTPPAIADLGTGLLVLMGGLGGELIALRGTDGREVEPGGPAAAAPIAGLGVGDLDGDGKNDALLTASDGSLYAAQGSVRRRIAKVDGRVVLPPAVSDLDRDGRAEAALVTTAGAVYLLKSGSAVPTAITKGARSAPVLADVDGDGLTEILVGGSDGLILLRSNGILQAGSPFRPAGPGVPATVAGPPVVADLDGDGSPDIVAAFGDYLLGFRGDGSPLPGLPVTLPGRVSASPLIGDLDGDGGLDLVVALAGGSIGRWDLRRLDASLKGKVVFWGQAGGGSANRNSPQNPGQAPAPPATGGILPPGRVYCYPNPVEGTDARIRFYLGREARVELRVLNTAAEVVEEISREAPTPGMDNEIAWDASGYAAGLYVCRLEAFGSDGTREVRFVKVAIKR